jgi:hypothetical protein
MLHISPTPFAIDFGVIQVVCLTTLPAAASRALPAPSRNGGQRWAIPSTLFERLGVAQSGSDGGEPPDPSLRC